MNHTFQISDEQFADIATYAEEHQQTPETLFQRWIEGVITLMDIQRSISNEPMSEEMKEEYLHDPLLRLAGVFSIKDPHVADRFDEYLAEAYADNHAKER